jgi:Lipase (class 3)
MRARSITAPDGNPQASNDFVENYRRVDQNFDIQQWVGMNTLELRQNVKIPQHQPIVQSLLECGDDVCLQGVVSKGGSADEKAEVAVFEGQRQFTAVFRGTTEQQCKPGAMIKAKKNGKGVAEPLDPEHGSVEVYSYYKEEYGKLEKDIFALLDKLTEQNPFCDVCFTGHSFGATMATLAAFRYANARPMMRVSCITLASPKVGFSAFKQLVNSSPNLKVMRLEFGQDGKCQLPSLGGYHVGHTLVLHGSLGHNSLKTNKPVLAYKFDAPKYKKFKTTHPDLRSYVNALEEVARLGLPWAKDFVGTSGQGVVVNNEARQMV